MHTAAFVQAMAFEDHSAMQFLHMPLPFASRVHLPTRQSDKLADNAVLSVPHAHTAPREVYDLEHLL